MNPIVPPVKPRSEFTKKRRIIVLTLEGGDFDTLENQIFRQAQEQFPDLSFDNVVSGIVTAGIKAYIK